MNPTVLSNENPERKSPAGAAPGGVSASKPLPADALILI
jgi:hypothetical protein